MKKRTKFKGLNDSTEDYELFPFVGHTLSSHTYTPQSHEELLRSYSKMKARKSGSTNYKHENEKLRIELKRVKEEVKRNSEEIEALRNRLANLNTDVTNNADVRVLDYRSSVDGTGVGYRSDQSDNLSRHFSEMMREYHNTLSDKNLQIKWLQEQLLNYERRNRRNPQEEQPSSNPAIEAERLRRTNAAIRVFRRDLDLVKTQLENSPLDEERFPCNSHRDRVVVEELRRRQRFGVTADLEAMGKQFFQRLEFEERLDELHWELESRRHRQRECAPMCTHHQEFQMLETTRNNLLKALRDLRAESPQCETRPQQTPLAINSLHTLYRSPSSYGSVLVSTSEIPDK